MFSLGMDIGSSTVKLVLLKDDWDETAWSRLRSFLYYC